MKTLKTTIAILVLAIVSTSSFAQKAKNIDMETRPASLKVCPMQLAEGVVVLKLTNQPEGNYTVKISDENGTVLMSQNLIHSNAASETVQFGKTLKGGTYTVEVVKPDNTIKTETVLLWM